MATMGTTLRSNDSLSIEAELESHTKRPDFQFERIEVGIKKAVDWFVREPRDVQEIIDYNNCCQFAKLYVFNPEESLNNNV